MSIKSVAHLSSAKIIFGITALIVVYFLVIFAGSRFRAEQADNQRSQLQAEIDSMQERYERLQALEQYLQSDEYVEKIAREQLGLVKPGETGVVILPLQPSPAPSPGAPSGNWWDQITQ
jgi:cell division protein DivIC